MDRELRKRFFNLLVYSSLDTKQFNFLGQSVDSSFDIYRISGFGPTIPIPRQTAAEIIVNYFDSQEKVVELFTVLLRNEGKRFYNATLKIYDRDPFISYLEKNKWVYDRDLQLFFLDPFFENDINFLKSIRIVDLCNTTDIQSLTEKIKKASESLKDKDLEWNVNLRLYDLDREISTLVQEIIRMLLTRQNLEEITYDLFACLKELSINASKANYKLLYEKLVTAPQGIHSDTAYRLFLEMFLDEIRQNGNKNLLKMAQSKNSFINITFQSTNTGIGVWVTNNQNITQVEKEAILKKIGYTRHDNLFDFADDDEFKEGAGLGIALVLSILHHYTETDVPLKVVFYPRYIKVGFFLTRSEIIERLEKKKAKEQES
jgi:hypothetical protein